MPGVTTLAAPSAPAAIAAREGGRPARFALLAYTGAAMRFPRYRDPLVIDLAGMKVSAKSRPVLRDHDPGRIVGHTTSVTVTARGLEVAGVVSGENADAREIVASAAKGMPWQVSGGWDLESEPEPVRRGESVAVNGRTFDGPVLVARRTQLKEVSFVALGADDDTAAEVTARRSSPRRSAMSLFSRRRRPAALSAASPHLSDEPDDNDGFGDGIDDDDGEGRVRPLDAAADFEEVRRQRAILVVAAQHPGMTISHMGRTVPLAEAAIEAGWDERETELYARRASRPAVTARRPETQAGAPDRRAVLVASLARSVGVPADLLAADREIGERAVDAAAASDVRDLGVQGLLRTVIAAAGERAPHGKFTNSTITAAFRANDRIQAGGFSTLSIPGVLGDVANRAMLAAFKAVPAVWPLIAAVGSVTDFKKATRFRLESVDGYREVAADGELKHVGLNESRHELPEAKTYGAIIGLTRKDIINDDLGALAVVPALLGRMAAVRLEETVFEMLLSNPAGLFSEANGNLLTGAGSELSQEGLEAAELLFRNATNTNGQPILATPSLLLTGTSQAVKARRLLSDLSTAERTGDGSNATTARTVTFAGNQFAGLKAVNSPYLNNTAVRTANGEPLSGQSDTQWFLFSKPADLALIEIAFLNGQQSPTVESSDAEFHQLGVYFRSYHDFTVGVRDRFAAVKSAGG